MAGFGFVKQAAEKAGKKMYGYGQKAYAGAQRNPELVASAGILGGTAAAGAALTQSGVLKADWDGSMQLGHADLNHYLRNEHEKWLQSEFNGEEDIMHMRDIAGKLVQSFKYQSSSEEAAMEKFRPAYEGFLMEAAKRKGSPSAEELHNMMQEMRGR
jgi:hypothetical protein